jgi:hypothetical protein
MPLFVRLSVLFMLACLGSGANAQEANAQERNAQEREVQVQLGIGIICDSAEQVERYLSLYTGNGSAPQSLHIVNAESKNPVACGVAAIAFVPDETVRTLTLSNHAVRVMRIRVIGTETENGWRQINELIQFTAMFENSEDA